MAAKTNRDKDLEALRHKVSDLEARMVRVNDRLGEMDDKLKERSAMDSEHEARRYVKCCNVIQKRLLWFYCEETATGVEVVMYKRVVLNCLPACISRKFEALNIFLIQSPPSPLPFSGNSVPTSS